MEKEKVPLALLYKKDGYINIEFTSDGTKEYEIYGFLECLIKKMKEDLTNSMRDKQEGE